MKNKLNAIATFLRVAEVGSFSEAARQTGMKQSAVSQQITALEEELGVVLLHRTTRVMALTEQGKRYRSQIAPLLNAMHEVESQLRPRQQQWRGRVHMQLPSGLGQIFLPHLLMLQKEHPDLNLTLALDGRLSELVSEGVDVALRLSSEPPDTLAARMLACVETPLFAAPDFASVNSLTELGTLPHVRFSSIAPTAPLRLVSEKETVELAVNTVFRANSSEGLLQALQAGIGVGGMQLPLAAKALQSGGLIRVLPGWRLPDRLLYAVFPDARFIPWRVRRIVQLIETILKNLPGVI
ncbi:LysR family transcriptional regulator [Pantoea septica]|uniref:LysR family transcriptional regulator n=1 Tax=Pantoea septica TaxID=472695 RepID=UPI0005357012|nr:LysR family transcriptional regulator [Pantoea septica]